MTTKKDKTKYWVAYDDNPHIVVGVWDTLAMARIDLLASRKADPGRKYTIYRVKRVRG